jgi:hypothetical protein
MKKFLLALVLASLAVWSASALPFSFGGGFGTDMNAPSGYGYTVNGSLHADYEIFRGLKAGASFSIGGVPGRTLAYVPTAYAKWYLPFTFGTYFTPFVRADAGVSVMYTDAAQDASVFFCSGGSAGIQFKISGFYAEPRVSFGFPYLWGADLSIGYSFK